MVKNDLAGASSYMGSLSSFLSGIGLSLQDVSNIFSILATIVGIILAIGTFFVNKHYKMKEIELKAKKIGVSLDDN
ncbi:HP1 family phage holin [Pasteurella multocida]|uniref:Phage holin family protein n=1 Tax=Pasteurella multocida TaxID=747 RepID=A0AAW8VAH7_PASMD|nr:HP1 family phage holin [Pasteurella multocida]MDH7436479.1 HP1 family phage holin [Pasteurella multocida]MDH7439720.1 HP1 family phage holin [Pasteurella multocida]MDT3453476.1 phage holin family protein [Pasteurella multocida]MDY0500287.1 phage holin family protein [Pasteurella multocida]MDY0516144.1 phage holin family protein [Pasteurella multocida]